MKRQFGQFFTTNSNYILQGLESFVKGKEITDPFAGNQDLINWCRANHCKKVVGFDCDKEYVDDKNVLYNDSINYPQNINLFALIRHTYTKQSRSKTKERFFVW